MLSMAPVRCSLLAALAASLRASCTAARVVLISPPTATTTCDTSCGCKSIKLLKPTNTAAIPTKLCKMATSSGISVISTFNAKRIPIAPPITMAIKIHAIPLVSGLKMVASRAIAIPKIPNKLPCFAVSCFDSPARLKMKRMAAIM